LPVAGSLNPIVPGVGVAQVDLAVDQVAQVGVENPRNPP